MESSIVFMNDIRPEIVSARNQSDGCGTDGDILFEDSLEIMFKCTQAQDVYAIE
jgi:hypothetical protein